MKYLFSILFILILFLGCTSSEKSQEVEVIKAEDFYSFEDGIVDLIQIEVTYGDADNYIEQLEKFQSSLQENTRDTSALKDFIQIKIELERSEKYLELANEDVNCTTVKHLSNFVESVEGVLVEIDSFTQNYPDLLNKTKIDSELVDKLNSTAIEVVPLINDLDTELNCN